MTVSNGLSRARDNVSGLWANIRTILIAVFFALLFRAFAYEPFNIPSGSMLPTLLVGDFLFVSKFSYGYSRHSLPMSLPLIPGRVLFTEPERGDVAVFKLPTDNRTDYIKRVMGLPGDRLQIIGGRLYINDEMIERRPTGQFVTRDAFGRTETLQRYTETLPNGRSYQILERSDNEPFDNTPVFQVPDGHYFALGDNRDNSLDSRALGQVGYIPRENLIGRAQFLFFSVDTEASDGVIGWLTNIRWERFFDRVSP